MSVWIPLSCIQQCLWVRVSKACFKLMIVLHAVLMENMCKRSCSPFMHMSALEKSRMRLIKPLHQDYFWEFSTESSKFHIFQNLNDPYSHVLLSANKHMKEGKENNIFVSWWWSQKNYCVACCCIFLLYLYTVGTIRIVKWKDAAITNCLKKCCRFLKTEKQHLG